MHSWGVVVAKGRSAIPRDVVAQLDDPAPDALTFPPAAHHRWSSADGTVTFAGWSHVPADEIGSYWEDRGSTLTAFSGRLWRDQAPWRPGRSWAAQLADRISDADIDDEVERFTGMFTMVHLRSGGSGWITADPLGTAMVYRAETETHAVVTNRAALAAALVTPPGRRAARDVDGVAHFAFTGSWHDGRTGFDAVQVIPQATVLHLGPGRPPEARTWSPMPWWDPSPVDLDTAVERALLRLRTAVRLQATAGAGRAVCELTGGKDSRLILALLLAEGLEHDVEFRTWGPPDLPDVVVATQLAERYGLDHRTGRGRLVDRTGRSRTRAGHRPSIPAAWSVRPLDLEEHYRHHVWASSGAISLWDLHTPMWPPSATLSLCGIAVETLSTNNAATARLTRWEHLAAFVDRGGFVYNSAGLLTRDADRHQREALKRELEEACPATGDVHDALDGYYVRGKLRRWSGAIAELDVRQRFFAAYDLPVLRDAFAIGSRARRGDLLHHHLMEACAPGLARIPFSGGGWAPELARSLPDGAGLPTRASGRSWLPVRAEIELYRARRLLHRSRNATIAELARRRRPGAGRSAEENRMTDLASKKAVLRSLLDLPAGHATWDLYDRARTLGALDRLERLPTQGRAEVHHAATVATWLDAGERRADVYVPTSTGAGPIDGPG